MTRSRLHRAGRTRRRRSSSARPPARSSISSARDSGRGEVVVVDMARARIVGRTRVGGPARHVTVSGKTLWVALGSKAELVAVLDLADPTRPKLIERFRPPFLAHDVGFEPSGRRVWVSSGDRGRLAVYDAGGGIVQRLPADRAAAARHIRGRRGLRHERRPRDAPLARPRRRRSPPAGPDRGRLLQRPGGRRAGADAVARTWPPRRRRARRDRAPARGPSDRARRRGAQRLSEG